ncbi:hypothetical protein Tco_0306697 [Tanacetum coccineum]
MSALKLPVLKTGDYDLWSMRMEQFLNHTDYALWEVIMNGDAPTIASASVGTESPIPPKTAEQKLACPQDLTYPLLEKPKTVRPSAPIIKDWDTDSDNDSVFRPKTDQTKPKFTKINFVKSDDNVKSVLIRKTHIGK